MPLGDATSAGIAQLVERNLAKVEVASSNLVSRSIPLTSHDTDGALPRVAYGASLSAASSLIDKLLMQ